MGMSAGVDDSVREAVLELFLGGDSSFPLESDMDLVEAGICDSMGLVQLAAALEGRYPGLEIQDQDVTRENMGSVSAIAAFIRRSGVAG